MPPMPPYQPPPPSFPAPMYPPQAAFLDLYGGYDDLIGLLNELRNYDVDLDPQDCNLAERYTYILWCCIAWAITLIGIVLWIRARRGQMTPFRRMVRLTVVVPCAIYAPVMLAFVGACLGQQKTQEMGLCIALIVVQPMCIVQILRCVRDACRYGIGARFFDLPLGPWEWRWLYYCLFFHGGMLACAVVMLTYVHGPGGLLLALEASLWLRLVRPSPSECPPGELEISLVLLGVALLITLGGHYSVRLATAYVPTYGGRLSSSTDHDGGARGLRARLGNLVRLRRRASARHPAELPPELSAWQQRAVDAQAHHQRCYRRAWFQGVTAPSGAASCVVAGTLLTCVDTHTSQELALYVSLAVVSLLALALCTYRCFGSAAATDPARWLYVGLLPYYATVATATLTCLVWHGTNGPLMKRRFVEIWDAAPQPANALFIFFSLVILLPLSFYSIVVYDPDESDAVADEGLPRLPVDVKDEAAAAAALATAPEGASSRRLRLPRTRKDLSALTTTLVRRAARRGGYRGRAQTDAQGGPSLASHPVHSPPTPAAVPTGLAAIPPPPIRPRLRSPEEEEAAAAAVAAGIAPPGPSDLHGHALAGAASSSAPAPAAASSSLAGGVEMYGVARGRGTCSDQRI